MRTRLLATLTTLAAMVLASATLAQTAAASPHSAPLPVSYSAASAYQAWLADPDAVPSGANDWSCKPTKAHPRPVILVHGTFSPRIMAWHTLSPLLKNQGYCVYALNYGAPTGSFLKATGPVVTSAMKQFGPFINQVLRSTGARRVDIVGQSQGGAMPRYWMRYGNSVWPDGTPKVGSVVGLNPGTHGTTLFGASMLAEMAPAGTDPLTYVCKACQDFYPHSTFMQRLNSTKHYPGERFAGEIQHGVTYTVISTKYDDVVTPYKSQFLLHPGVHNIVLQDGCPIDLSDHLSGLFDPRALDFITNALDPAHARTPRCVPVLPLASSLS